MDKHRLRWEWNRVPFGDKLNVGAGFIGLFVAAIAIGLSGFAVLLTREQGRLAMKQTEIVERQFQIQRRQLEREADVFVSFMPDKAGHFRILLTNRGLVDVQILFAEVALKLKQLDCKRPGQTHSDSPAQLVVDFGKGRRERQYFGEDDDFTVSKESDYVLWECTSPEVPKTAWDLHEITAEWNVRTRDRLFASPKPMMGDSHFDPPNK
jgi:hypothetical protein